VALAEPEEVYPERRSKRVMEYGLVVLWLVTLLGLGLAALPVAAVVFERLPDRGAGVAVPLALAVVAIPAYWVGQVTFGLPAVLAGLVVLAGASLLAHRRFEASPDWGSVADTAAVFAAAFCFLVAIRAVDPAVHPLYGEKFLDYGMLKATLRADTLPPEDFWFAGEPVAYYYGGHFVAALLTRLTGTAANYAYNLSLAAFYAMYVTAAFGLGGAIGDARGASRRVAGLSTVFFLAVASNIATPLRALAGSLPMSVLTTAAPEDADTFAKGLDAFGYWAASRAMGNGLITEFPLFAFLNGDLHAHMMSPPFTLLVAALLFAYFRTPESAVRRRRLLVFGCVPPLSGLLVFMNTWTALTPAGLTALTLYFAPSDPTTLLPGFAGRPLRQVAGAEEASTIAADGGGADAPDADLLVRVKRAVRLEGVRGAMAGAGAASVVLAGFVFVVPFLTGSASSRSLELWAAAERTGLTGLLVAHGGFVLVFVAYLRSRFVGLFEGSALSVGLALFVLFVVGVAQDFQAFGLLAPLVLVGWVLLRSDLVTTPGEGDTAASLSSLPTPALVVAALAPVVLVVALEFAPALLAGVAVLAPVALVVGVGRAARGTDPDDESEPGVGFETLLMIAGAGLVAIVEVVYVVEYAAPGRFNTVFKTYTQVWALWAVAAGAMLGTMLHRQVVAPLAARASGDDVDVPAVPVVLAVLLVASLSLYGGLATERHFTGSSIYTEYQRVDDPTLNATAYVQDDHPAEAAAIRWLDDRDGTPTIVTSPGGGYRWQPSQRTGGPAPASLTGLPTVMGFPHHVRGFRGPGNISSRVEDAEAIYRGDPEQRACLLAKYDVRYVYVGPIEMAKYRESATDVSRVTGVGEPKVFGDGRVRIYPVDQEALPESGTC
jgi:YYY domain-containing protein